jgi:HSP20 family molecular chaperone IbpA
LARVAADKVTHTPEPGTRHPVRWVAFDAGIEDDGAKIVVTIDAPGIDPADLQFEVRGKVLVMRGARTVVHHGRRGFIERSGTRIARAIRLPAAVDIGSARTTEERGRVTIALTRTDPVRRIRIEAH